MKHETLNNTYARNPCAYCRKHNVSLTVKQVKFKECLKKQCWYLVKYNHEWWKQREVIKEKKKNNKKKKKNLLDTIQNHCKIKQTESRFPN